MENQLKPRSQMDPAYQWDLSSLFVNDQDWQTAYDALKDHIDDLSIYQDHLTDGSTIKSALDLYYDLNRQFDRLFCYASLRHSEDITDSIANNMYNRAISLAMAFEQNSAFIKPQLLALDPSLIQSLLHDEQLKDYHFILESLFRQKSHTLTADQEALLAGFSEVFQGPDHIQEALSDADLKFDDAIDKDGVNHPLSNASYIMLQSSNDRTLRKSSFEKYYAAYGAHNQTYAAIYANQVKTTLALAKAHHYPSSRNMVMDADNIDESVYDTLIEAVHDHLELMHRYVALRKRLLKLDEVHYYDIYAPLVSDGQTSYTYKQAQDMIVDALSVFGDDYIHTVKDGFTNKWIDVYPNIAKSGGAYSSGCYDSNPYILTNFTGTLDSVSTIAHEMGHSMHTHYANTSQSYANSNYSLFVAEVASTVNENLLVHHLLDHQNDPTMRLRLLNQYLEGFKGTVYRQTMFAEFEKTVHAYVQQGGNADSAYLNGLYMDLTKAYFGLTMVYDDAIQYEWSRIPHFYRPFYVYVYACGYCAANALAYGMLNDATKVKPYLEFLKMGGSRYPLDELKHAGIDLTNRHYLDTAFEEFARILDEVEALADQLGY